MVEAELTSLGGRDQQVHKMYDKAWEKFIETVGAELYKTFPRAGHEECHRVAYALTCLGEQDWWLTFVGPGAGRRGIARKAGELLVAQLASKHADLLRTGGTLKKNELTDQS